LAKELGLKSPELLDRIQRWGLDVKVSALASLDPGMVDRIKALMNHPNATPEPAPAPAPAGRSTPSPEEKTEEKKRKKWKKRKVKKQIRSRKKRKRK